MLFEVLIDSFDWYVLIYIYNTVSLRGWLDDVEEKISLKCDLPVTLATESGQESM